MKDVLVEAIFDEGYIPPIDYSAERKYSIRETGSDSWIITNVSRDYATSVRAFYRSELHKSVDIIETWTETGDGFQPFADGNAPANSHIISHNVSHDPMFDVSYLDTNVGYGISENELSLVLDKYQPMADFAHIAHLGDVAAAMIEAINDPEFSLEDTINAIAALVPSLLTFVSPLTIIQRNPAANDAPPPPPAARSRNAAHEKALRKFIRRSHITETAISGHINEKNHRAYLMRAGYSVIDVRELREVRGHLSPRILFTGSKENCESFISQQTERRGNHVYDYRIVRYSKRHAYLREVKTSGYRVTRNGQTLVIGTKSDIVRYFVLAKISDKSGIKMTRLAR